MTDAPATLALTKEQIIRIFTAGVCQGSVEASALGSTAIPSRERWERLGDELFDILNEGKLIIDPDRVPYGTFDEIWTWLHLHKPPTLVDLAHMKWPELRKLLWARFDDDDRSDDALVATRAEMLAVLSWCDRFNVWAKPRTDEEEATFNLIRRAAALIESAPPQPKEAK